MNITPITKFRVDSCEFNTEEDARAYIKSKINEKFILARNIDMLDNFAIHGPYIPTKDSEGGLRLFFKRYNNFDQWEGYEDILGREHLRYVKSELKIINSREFIDEFIKQADTFSIDAQDLGMLIGAVKAHLLEYFGGENMSQIVSIYADVLDALAKVHYAPVYIND